MDQRNHKSVQTQVQISDPPPWTNHKRWSETSAPRRAERSQRGRPAGLAHARVEAKQLIPTLGRDQKRPGEGGGHVATSLGQPT